MSVFVSASGVFSQGSHGFVCAPTGADPEEGTGDLDPVENSKKNRVS